MHMLHGHQPTCSAARAMPARRTQEVQSGDNDGSSPEAAAAASAAGRERAGTLAALAREAARAAHGRPRRVAARFAPTLCSSRPITAPADAGEAYSARTARCGPPRPRVPATAALDRCARREQTSMCTHFLPARRAPPQKPPHAGAA
jgi:hypothetical protein